MKMNIQITKIETGFLKFNEEIVNIDINNGNWKYWDRFSETEEKTPLTMNNFHDATILGQPVKDALPHYDEEKWENEDELVQDDAYVRTYDTLMGYLNCRIGNLKDSYKRRGKTELITNIVLFNKKYVRSNEDDIVGNAVYEAEDLLEVKITIVE